MAHSLILIEDDVLVRENIGAYFTQHQQIRAIKAYNSIEEALKAPLQEIPDLILLDIALPEIGRAHV